MTLTKPGYLWGVVSGEVLGAFLDVWASNQFDPSRGVSIVDFFLGWLSIARSLMLPHSETGRFNGAFARRDPNGVERCSPNDENCQGGPTLWSAYRDKKIRHFKWMFFLKWWRMHQQSCFLHDKELEYGRRSKIKNPEIKKSMKTDTGSKCVPSITTVHSKKKHETSADLPPITQDEIRAAKAGWSISALGLGQIPVATVRSTSEVELERTWTFWHLCHSTSCSSKWILFMWIFK